MRANSIVNGKKTAIGEEFRAALLFTLAQHQVRVGRIRHQHPRAILAPAVLLESGDQLLMATVHPVEYPEGQHRSVVVGLEIFYVVNDVHADSIL
jgi:hypothetical protein